jgi:adenine-specific DNA-methyltransferase
LHRGLDLLRDGGRLAFVLPSYWTASTAARPLIERLKTETSIREVILLGRSPVFPQVQGWHLILSLVKGRDAAPCRVWDLSAAGKQVAHHLDSIPESSSSLSKPKFFTLEQSDLFQQGQLSLTPPDHRLHVLASRSLGMLHERFEVRQGIVENPRRITRAMAAKAITDYTVGQGVFVLSEEERDRLDLSPRELRLLRPYYRGTDIERYWLADRPAEFLLYLTRETAASLEAFPNVEAHLSRFRPLLENRREVMKGRIAWWHLHWPREEELFLAPRILMPQMGYSPRFVFAEKPAFVGFSMHVLGRKKSLDGVSSVDSLCALTGVLNSELSACWFRRFAKHRGAALDISGTLLRQFPLPPDNRERECELAQLVRQRQNLKPDSAGITDLETEIESCVQSCYALRNP